MVRTRTRGSLGVGGCILDPLKTLQSGGWYVTENTVRTYLAGEAAFDDVEAVKTEAADLADAL